MAFGITLHWSKITSLLCTEIIKLYICVLWIDNNLCSKSPWLVYQNMQPCYLSTVCHCFKIQVGMLLIANIVAWLLTHYSAVFLLINYSRITLCSSPWGFHSYTASLLVHETFWECVHFVVFTLFCIWNAIDYWFSVILNSFIWLFNCLRLIIFHQQ